MECYFSKHKKIYIFLLNFYKLEKKKKYHLGEYSRHVDKKISRSDREQLIKFVHDYAPHICLIDMGNCC